jgi:hypothetical protein
VGLDDDDDDDANIFEEGLQQPQGLIASSPF